MKINNKEDFQAEINNISQGNAIIQCTDKLIVDTIPGNINWDDVYKHGIDIRIFDKSKEIRFFRGTIADDFVVRKKTDENLTEDNHYDEDQFLDINDKCEKVDGKVQAIGGGKYGLHLNNIRDAKIRIRNYISYEEDTGMAYVSDWRCVEFLEGKANG